MNWIRKILGFNHPERIAMELIERLPAHKFCRKKIDRELDADIETEDVCSGASYRSNQWGANQYFYNSDDERTERTENTFIKLGAMQVADRKTGYQSICRQS